MYVCMYVHKLKLLWLAGRLRRQGPYTYMCVRAYVRAQVEVAMAGWTTEETRALYIYMCVRTYVHKLKLLWLAGRLRRRGPC